MKIDSRVIEYRKNSLINYAKKWGMFENFEQQEVRKLEEKYLNLETPYSDDWKYNKAKIDEFNNWCMNYCG